jgi:hypothetical protein
MRRLPEENEAIARSLRGGRILAVFATIVMRKNLIVVHYVCRGSLEMQLLNTSIDDKQQKGPASSKGLPADPGFTWELLCITLLALGVLAGMAAFLILLANGKNPGFLITITTLILTVLALKLTPRLSNKYRARQRLVVLRIEELIREDTRPPVLYLRAFKDDHTIARAIGFKSIEQEMKLVLFDIGPFIAFAEPNNEPADPGAARIYAAQEHWQVEVGKKCRRRNS